MTFVFLTESGERLLKEAMARLMWSARAYHRILKISENDCRSGPNGNDQA